MTKNSRQLVVVGHGAAGLAAALSAAEHVRSRGLRIDITDMKRQAAQLQDALQRAEEEWLAASSQYDEAAS